MAYLFLGLYYNFSIWYKLKDKTHYGAMIAVIGSIITIALNWFLVPKFGYLGAAYAALACFFTMVILAILLGRKFMYIPYPFLKMIMTIVFALIIFFFQQWLIPDIEQVFVKILLNTGLLLLFITITLLLQREIIVEFLKPHTIE